VISYLSRRRGRRWSNEDGFSLIEAVASLLVLMLFLSALLGSIIIMTRQTLANRTRNTATAVGNEMVETARSLSFSALRILDDGTVPATYTYKGQTWSVDRGTPCPGCLQHRSSIVRQGVTYSVTQWVLLHDSYTDAAGEIQRDKRLVVEVSWSVPRAATYRADTIIHNTDPLAKPVIQGLRFEVLNTNGEILNDEDATFDVTITGGSATVQGATAEGVYQNYGLAVGAYTCTVESNPSSQNYYPEGNPTGTSHSQPCSVTAGGISLVQSRWEAALSCTASSTNGQLNVTIVSQSGQPVVGANVELISNTDNSSTVATTGSNGVASFTRPSGPYRFTATAEGYEPMDSPGSACIFPEGVSTASASIAPVSAAPPESTMNVFVTVTNNDKLRSYEVRVTRAGGSVLTSPLSIPVNQSKTASFLGLEPGTYSVEVCIVAGRKCNRLQFWSGQAFTSAGTDYTLTATDAAGKP
jgi:Tfp pilus assembly protein PilV